MLAVLNSSEHSQKILNIDLQIAETPKDLEQILQETPKDQVVLIDSFGCNPYNSDDLKDLSPFLKMPNVEPVLTIAAGGDAAEAADIGQAFKFNWCKTFAANSL